MKNDKLSNVPVGTPENPHFLFVDPSQLCKQVDVLSDCLVADNIDTVYSYVPGGVVNSYTAGRFRIVFWPLSKRTEIVVKDLKAERRITPLFPEGATNCCFLVLKDNDGPKNIGVCWGPGVPVWTLKQLHIGITPHINVALIEEIADRAKEDARRIVDILGRNILHAMDTAMIGAPGVTLDAIKEARKGDSRNFKVFRIRSSTLTLDLANVACMSVEVAEDLLRKAIDMIVQEFRNSRKTDKTIKFIRPGIQASYKVENYILEIFFHCPCVRRANQKEIDEFTCDYCQSNLDGIAPSMPYSTGSGVGKRVRK